LITTTIKPEQPLNPKRVSLRLHGWPEEFEGKLLLDDLLVPTGREKTVRLRLGRLTFENTDIEFCRTLD
jgi:hypothetical protein